MRKEGLSLPACLSLSHSLRKGGCGRTSTVLRPSESFWRLPAEPDWPCERLTTSPWLETLSVEASARRMGHQQRTDGKEGTQRGGEVKEGGKA